ncbi:flagellar basal body-associated protein FliL [Rossellomorea sp. BNER]|jgi:flagellar protein FliL|uniref:flagellar basal body-associated protein FliL n=1 Tax=Rossellomorea sp. BNER TaxID=2962031 RepID=UPI003AF238A3|nr:flagellar basal body-associated protein FliL [Rossellomorea sp. BNER]
MKNKLLTVTLILIATTLLVGVMALIVILKFDKDENTKPTIDEVLEASVDIPEITTNLRNNDFIKISFKMQTENKDAKEELQKRDFQVQNIIINELSELTPEKLEGKEGKLEFQEQIEEKVNSLMQEGKVEKVYITSYIIQ